MKQREASFRTAAIKHFVARIELALFVSEEQRASLQTFVDEKYGDMLVNHLKIQSRVRVPGITAMNALKSDFEKELGEILTEIQLEQWNRVIEPVIQGMETDIQRTR